MKKYLVFFQKTSLLNFVDDISTVKVYGRLSDANKWVNKTMPTVGAGISGRVVTIRETDHFQKQFRHQLKIELCGEVVFYYANFNLGTYTRYVFNGESCESTIYYESLKAYKKAILDDLKASVLDY